MALMWELVRAAALLLVLWSLTAAARWLREYRRFRRMELAIPGPRSLPLLGNALAFLGINHHNILNVLLGLWGQRDGISRASIFNRLLVFVSHPDDIGLVVRDRRFNDKPWFFYGALADLLGEGLATSGGDLWRSHRAIVDPTFHVDILDGYVDMFNEEAQVFVRAMRPHAEAGVETYPFDTLHASVARATLRSTMSSKMEPGEETSIQRLVDGFRPTLEGVARRTYNVLLWPEPVFRMTPTNRAQDAYKRVADAYAESIIARNRKLEKEVKPAAKPSKVRKTFLEHLMEGKTSKGAAGGQYSLSDSEIVDEVKTVFSAAVETSTTVSCFAMKLLSIHPDVQERAYAEVRDVLGGSARAVTAKDLSKMVYLERVAKETLRLFPALPLVARTVHQDTEFNDKVIPAGSVVIINIISVHRDPRFHKDPLRFDPDRFERNRSAGRHPFCYLPFSAGARNCVGQRSGMQMVKTVLANVLMAYKVEPVQDGITEPSQFPLTSDLAIRFVGGIRIKFKPRTTPTGSVD